MMLQCLVSLAVCPRAWTHWENVPSKSNPSLGTCLTGDNCGVSKRQFGEIWGQAAHENL
jgi:hypothetical protein